MSIEATTFEAGLGAEPSAADRKLGVALLVIASPSSCRPSPPPSSKWALPMERSLHLPLSHLNWVASFYALSLGGLLIAGTRGGLAISLTHCQTTVRQSHLPDSESSAPHVSSDDEDKGHRLVREIPSVTSFAWPSTWDFGLNGVNVTSNRARKRAARERAAATGERYVIASRKLEEPPPIAGAPESERPYPFIVRLVHDLTHRVPGVPKHADPGSIRAEHDARHKARAGTVKARHQAHAAAANARHH